MAPRITSSSNRSTRKRSKNPTSSRNRPQRSRASTNSSRITRGDAVSRYKPLQGRGALSVTQSPGSNAYGAGAAKVTQGATQRSLLSRFASGAVRLGPVLDVLLMLGGDSPKNRPGTVGYNQQRQGQASESIDKYNTMDPDGTVRNRLKVGPAKVGDGSSDGSGAKSFDNAFRKARESGLAEFTWNGKRYTTEMA